MKLVVMFVLGDNEAMQLEKTVNVNRLKRDNFKKCDHYLAIIDYLMLSLKLRNYVNCQCRSFIEKYTGFLFENVLLFTSNRISQQIVISAAKNLSSFSDKYDIRAMSGRVLALCNSFHHQ